MEPVVFGDVEVALADYLGSAFTERMAGATVYNAVPAQRPKRFARVVRVGGSQANAVTDRPRVVTEFWDTLGVGAYELAALGRALIVAVAPGYLGEIWVDRVVDMGLSFSPDPATGSPRYIFPAELWCRGTVLG